MQFHITICHTVFVVHHVSNKYVTNSLIAERNCFARFVIQILSFRLSPRYFFWLQIIQFFTFWIWWPTVLVLFARLHVGLGDPIFANNIVELEVSLFRFNSNRSFFLSIICIADVYLIFNIVISPSLSPCRKSSFKNLEALVTTFLPASVLVNLVSPFLSLLFWQMVHFLRSCFFFFEIDVQSSGDIVLSVVLSWGFTHFRFLNMKKFWYQQRVFCWNSTVNRVQHI